MAQPNRQIEKRNRRLVGRNQWGSILLLCFGVVFCYFIFPSSQALQQGAYSEHMWRQADAHALTYNYYTDSSSFFRPRVFDLGSAIEARAIQEFPLLYYLAAKWDQFQGVYRPSTVNIFHFCFLCIGFIAFGLGTIILTANRNVSLFLYPILLMGIWSSGILQYFGLNNFPDIPSTSFTLLGLLFFLAFKKEGRNSYLWFSVLFFLLAGLLKISFLLYPITFFSLHIIWPTDSAHRHKLSIALITLLVINGLWIGYIKYYNNLYQSTIFLTQIMPIWTEDSDQIKWVLNRLYGEYLDLFLMGPWKYIFGSLFLINLFFLPLREKLIQLGLLIGIVCFYLLFFAQLSVHSYYLILLTPLVIITAYFFVDHILPILSLPKSLSGILFLGGVLVLILQIQSTNSYLEENYKPNNKHHTYLDIPPEYLDEKLMSTTFLNLGIEADDKIISCSDWSFNITLNTCKRYGWTLSWKEFSPKTIDSLYQKGDAKYLIYWGEHEDLAKENHMPQKIKSFNSGTVIYALQD